MKKLDLWYLVFNRLGHIQKLSASQRKRSLKWRVNNMTYGEAIAMGYREKDVTYTRGYLERKTDSSEREVKAVKRSGRRSSQG